MGNPFYYTSQLAFDMSSGSTWGSMNISMNQAWEDMIARQSLYQVPRYDFSNFNLYTTPTVNIPFGFGIGSTPTFGNPFPQIVNCTLQQLDWQNKRAGGNGFLDANGNFSYKPNYSWAGFTPSGTTPTGGANGPAAQTEEDRDYQRKYNTLLAIVKQLANCKDLTRKEKDDLNAVARQTVKNWKEGYTELKKVYDKIDKDTVKEFLKSAKELSAIDDTLDADKKDSFYNQLQAAGYESYNKAIDDGVQDLYTAISNLSSESSNIESNDLIGSLVKGDVDILDLISSYNSEMKDNTDASDKRIISHIAAQYSKLTDEEGDDKETVHAKVLSPLVNALVNKANEVKRTLDAESAKKIDKAIGDIRSSLNKSKDKIDSNLSSAFDTLYLLTRMGAIAHVRNQAVAYYGEVDTEVFNQELFEYETVKDLKKEGFTADEIENSEVKVKNEAVVKETEDVDDVEDTDDEEEIKPNRKLDKEAIDKQIETLIANDVLVETKTKYTITDSEGNEKEYTVYENKKGDKRVFIVKDDKIVELKNAEIKNGKVVEKSADNAITEVEAKASDIEVAHKEAVNAADKAEKERKAQEKKAEKETKETIQALVDAGILTPCKVNDDKGNRIQGYKETRATGDRTQARFVKIEGSVVRVYDYDTKSWRTPVDIKSYFEDDFKVMTEQEIEDAKKIGDKIKALIDGYTTDDDWAEVKSNVGKINKRNVLYVIKAFNDDAFFHMKFAPREDFFTHCQSEYQDEKVDKLTKPVLECVIEFIDDNLDSLDAIDREKVLQIKKDLQAALNELTVDTKGNYIDKQINSLIEIFQID